MARKAKVKSGKGTPGIVFEDILICPPQDESSGEHELNRDQQDRVARLYLMIEHIARVGIKKHVKVNYKKDGVIKKNKRNTITRVITSEFAFYTKTPLTMNEFLVLQAQIIKIMKNLGENLQLILSSFAVQTELGVMNVVVQVDSGLEPNIHFIVKSYTSDVDAEYKDSRHKKLANLDVDSRIDIADKFPFTLDGKEYHFNFDTVSIRKTAGGLAYFSCVEICLDHYYGVAKDDLQKKISELIDKKHTSIPQYCTQVLTSNTISPRSNNMVADLTQADPKLSRWGGRTWLGSTKESSVKPLAIKKAFKALKDKVVFGAQLLRQCLVPLKASLLPESMLKQVKEHNRQHSQTLVSAGGKTSSNGAFMVQQQSNRSLRSLNKQISSLRKEHLHLSDHGLCHTPNWVVQFAQQVRKSKLAKANSDQSKPNKRIIGV